MKTDEDTTFDIFDKDELGVEEELKALHKVLISSNRFKGINYQRVLEVQNKLLNGELAALGDIKAQYASALNIADKITQGNAKLWD